MRVLLLGATGLIGSAVAARLVVEGHEVVGVARTFDSASRRVPVARWIRLDLRTAVRPQDWRPHLAGIDAIVNCAGVLQDSARDS
ncbi:MAG: NAD-dependent epimerase/dehydratase family protein, partial [Allosphingosinicella sp.]